MEPKSSQNRIRYTKEMKEAIAKIICQTQAYKRTERSKESKYQEVERTVAIHPAFRDLPNKPTAMAIEKEFKRMTNDLLERAGMSKEGANVSALPDAPTDHEQLLMNMAEECHNSKVEKANDKEKKRKVQQALFGHETEGLRAQGVINMSLSLRNGDNYDYDDADNAQTSDSQDSSEETAAAVQVRAQPQVKKPKSHRAQMSELEKAILNDIKGVTEEDDLLRESLRLDIEAKKLAIEEKKLQAEEGKIKALKEFVQYIKEVSTQIKKKAYLKNKITK